MSIWDSDAKLAWVPPKPRNEPAGTLVVRTMEARVATARQR